jgi:catechol 2,3-dioxygenase-like lactoylglutathione lyase family enzyme
MPPIVIPMLPCADIDEIADFFTALGFTVVYRQVKPNPFVALEGYGFPIQYYGLDGHLPEASHSTCGVVVADTVALFEAFAAGLRERYGKLPVAGLPPDHAASVAQGRRRPYRFQSDRPCGQLDPGLRGRRARAGRRVVPAPGCAAQRRRPRRQQRR